MKRADKSSPRGNRAEGPDGGAAARAVPREGCGEDGGRVPRDRCRRRNFWMGLESGGGVLAEVRDWMLQGEGGVVGGLEELVLGGLQAFGRETVFRI